jgi:hypothetical protein
MVVSFEESVGPEPDPRKLLFDSGGGWRVYRHAGGWLYVFETRGARPRRYESLVMDRSFRRGMLFFPRPAKGRRPYTAFLFPLDEMLFQHYLARHGGLELHACAVKVRGRVLVFCGASGAGKTTTARLWERYHPHTRILSDDRVVIRMRRGRPWAFGTPWHGLGRFALPDGGPLAGIFFLGHGQTTRIDPLLPAPGAAWLLARGFPPVWDAGAMARALALGDRVVRDVPCYRIAFRRDRSAVDHVLDLFARRRLA